MARETYDAIVVGSGITGGWAAKELTEKGLEVLMLERGRPIEHGAGYVTEHRAAWELEFRGQGDPRLYAEEYAVQSQTRFLDETIQHLFVNDNEHPYKQDPDKPFLWIRGYHLGGRSIMWGRQSYRWSDLDFEANARDGIEIDWPIRYSDLAPWYDHVERFAGISGQAEGLPQLPDGEFLPPMPLNCVEAMAKEKIEQAFPERRLTIGRSAVLTRPHNGRAACHYCGPCWRGCSTGSYFSTQSATLPAAMATRRLTVRTHSIVESVLYDERKDRATGVRVIDAETREAREIDARVVFLCASTLASTQILLNSKTPRFPDGLGNSSGVLGHYLMDHPFEAGAYGFAPGFEDRYYLGRRPNGIYIPRFQNLDGRDRGREFLRGYGFQGGAWRQSWKDRGIDGPEFGADFKRSLRDPGPWMMGIGGFGECLPRYENSVELDPEETDSWGIPLLRTQASWSDNELAIKEDAQVTGAEMLEAAGLKHVGTFNRESAPGLCIHEMGTARMGSDPKTSVLNAYNQCHDVPNVFVTDGSCMTSSACQNPSLTYMALTARACDHAVGELKRGHL